MREDLKEQPLRRVTCLVPRSHAEIHYTRELTAAVAFRYTGALKTIGGLRTMTEGMRKVFEGTTAS